MSQVCYKHPRYTQYFIVIIVLLYNHSTPWYISRGLANTLTRVLEKHLYARRAAGCGLGSNQGLFGWQRRKAAWARHHSQVFDFERLGWMRMPSWRSQARAASKQASAWLHEIGQRGASQWIQAKLISLWKKKNCHMLPLALDRRACLIPWDTCYSLHSIF